MEVDERRTRQLVYKIVKQMVQKIDVSTYFADMIKVAASQDPIVKKLAYIYLAEYTSKNPELAVLAVNTIHKDIKDSNPFIRAMALKTLSSLRVPSSLQWAESRLKLALSDKSDYVKKVAASACIKAYHHRPEFAKDHGVAEQLHSMLRSHDPDLVVTCLVALDQIMKQDGGLSPDKNLAHYLLNRLSHFKDWGLCFVLKLMLKYDSEDSEETFDILNIVDGYLRHPNSAVAMATVELMLYLARYQEKIQRDVYDRFRGPLLSMINRNGDPELSYVALCHSLQLARRCPALLQEDHTHFYCRFNDVCYVKIKKLEILSAICCKRNYKGIIDEISAHCMEVSEQISGKAIQSLAELAKRAGSPPWRGRCMDRLIGLLRLHIDQVIAQVMAASQDLLKYEGFEEYRNQVLQLIPECLPFLRNEQGKAALIWILGQYGQDSANSPYILEDFIDAIKEESSSIVKLHLLSATAKLFFRRPPEVHGILGRVLQHCIAQQENFEVQERAIFIYHLLKVDFGKAQDVLCAPLALLELPPNCHAQTAHQDWNSLSFTVSAGLELKSSESRGRDDRSKFREPACWLSPPCPHTSTGTLIDVGHSKEPIASASVMAAESMSQVETLTTTGTLIDVGHPEEPMSSAGVPAAESTSQVKRHTSLVLSDQLPTLTPDQFEGIWLEPKAESVTMILELRTLVEPQQLEVELNRCLIQTMATTHSQLPWKAFFYAQDTEGTTYLLELCLKHGKVVEMKCKCKLAPDLQITKEKVMLKEFIHLIESYFLSYTK